MTHSSLPAQFSAPSLPDPKSVPGFSLAQHWLDRHRPDTAALLAAAGGPPPDEDEPQDALAEAAAAETLRWPRIGALPSQALLILTLAAAIERQGGAKPGAPAQLALIHGWCGAELAAAQGLWDRLEILRALFHSESEAPLRQTGSPAGALADQRRKLCKQIEDSLMTGRGVVAINLTPADLPSALQPLCTHELRLPRPDRSRVAALMRLLFPQARDLAGVLAQLPGEEALARLMPLELVTALHAATPGAALDILRRRAMPAPVTAGQVAGLETVAGQPQAVAAFRQLAADMSAWRDGKLAWSAVPRSLILHGPPGTGKTLLAGAFAAEAGLPLIATGFSECQKAGHLGDMLAALEAAVAEAISRAPAIFFLDELDGFSSREAGAGSRNGTYMRAVITGLLRQLDRLMSTPGVVLIGATNDLRAIDGAIRRPGRFDRLLRLNAPNRAGIAQILRHHLDAAEPGQDPVLDEAIAEAAGRLVGTSGAAAAALARAALARARGDALPLAAALAAEAEARHQALTLAEQRRVALHEAGHVLVGVLGGMPDPVAMRLTPSCGQVEWRPRAMHTRESALAELRMNLGGRAAEEVLCGTISTGAGAGPSSDLAHSTRLVLAMELEWGFGDGGLLWHPGLPTGLQAPNWLRAKLDHLLTTAAAEARALVATHRGTVEALAEALIVEREIEGEALSAWVTRIRDLGQQREDRDYCTEDVGDVLTLKPK
ncbi:AAA family ATPase [Szabonella alba]|uniref:AAA family ATPase n=1 Tax=Szabonella alba TaxID=2804194 RepID=A0A8K0VC99_9RHOB|nr:AAA family ATPase [Szabonella alba]MBL4917593.1 AAA family ATPase [Szabonella alba]